VLTTTIIVTGVLSLCAFGGVLILVMLLKGLRKRPKTFEYCDVYAPSATYISVQSYAEVSSGASYVSVQSYADVGSESRYATGYSCVAVL
jgi:hypothetical protein